MLRQLQLFEVLHRGKITETVIKFSPGNPKRIF